jgi:hypothetical protein
MALAERIIAEARAHGAMVSKKVDGQHVLDRAPFDPQKVMQDVCYKGNRIRIPEFLIATATIM